MDYNALCFEEFSNHRPWKFNLTENVDELNRQIARQAVDAIKSAGKEDRQILIIMPVGPLNYSYWADLCNTEKASCRHLVTMSMDEYLDKDGNYIDKKHPLSFRRYIDDTLVKNLQPELRPLPENVNFPDPHSPEKTTAIIESFGGADICYGGLGITGHFAFNDPPEPDENLDDEDVRNSRTRCLTITRESHTQMCMGGTHGNWDIIPHRAVTLGMYELLKSKKIHLTFMRSWHAGVLRRAFFGEMCGKCPGSFIQEHPSVEVTLTKTAAAVPLLNVAQATGELVNNT